MSFISAFSYRFSALYKNMVERKFSIYARTSNWNKQKIFFIYYLWLKRNTVILQRKMNNIDIGMQPL